MNFVDLIIKKRDKKSLTSEEINYFVKRASDKNFPDYQISAMLMAIYLNGLNYKETSDLTMAMANSGKILDLSQIKGIKVDKHSTGGVADTTTLVLAPLVASCGLPVVKMSGRGLGHTGGTVDKLEAISGFNTEVSEETAVELVKKQNIVIMGQSEDLAPADKRFYAMRDVTGTVESIPLIASSIMSKKIAAGCDALVLDVKCGNGSFMKDFSSAEKLAETMVEIGENINKKVIAIITDMNEPLGKHIGNSLEVIEAIEILKGNISGRLKEVSLELGSLMLILGNICETKEEARTLLEENIKNQKGLKKFKELIVSQKGNPEIIDDYSLFPKCKFKKELTSEFSGYISDMDTYNIGRAACEAGAGRKTKTDKIHSSSEERLKNAENILKSCIKISENPLKSKKTILKIIGG